MHSCLERSILSFCQDWVTQLAPSSAVADGDEVAIGLFCVEVEDWVTPAVVRLLALAGEESLRILLK
jgi:hypothetical protein